MNEQPTTPEQRELKTSNKPSKGAILAIIILSILALGGVGYSVYAWQQNKTIMSNISSQKGTIKDLEQQVASLSSQSSGATTESNTIAIRELGISITVPDSIKDLTYSYTSGLKNSIKRENVTLSTKGLTDRDSQCTSFGIAPPLGLLSKVTGQYPADANVDNAPGPLLKQFSSFYLAYSGPQSLCADAQTTSELNDFKKSLSTIKELQ